MLLLHKTNLSKSVQDASVGSGLQSDTGLVTWAPNIATERVWGVDEAGAKGFKTVVIVSLGIKISMCSKHVNVSLISWRIIVHKIDPYSALRSECCHPAPIPLIGGIRENWGNHSLNHNFFLSISERNHRSRKLYKSR